MNDEIIEMLKQLREEFDMAERGEINHSESSPESSEDEYERLMTELRSCDFSSSRELSAYIIEHELGKKYPNVTGIVTMKKGGREWEFDGGFPRETYKRICVDLQLTRPRSNVRAVGFRNHA